MEQSIGSRFTHLVLLILLALIASQPQAHAQTEPKTQPEPEQLTPEQQALLERADRHAKESRDYLARRKLPEAIEAHLKCLELERKALPRKGPRLLGSLQRLAEMQQKLDFAGAEKTLEELLTLESEVHGKAYWHLVDTRLDLEEVRRKSKLSEEQLTRLREADVLIAKANKLRARGDYRAAVDSINRAVEVWKDLLGEKSKRYAIGLGDTGMLMAQFGDYAGAEKVLRHAADVQSAVFGKEHWRAINTRVTLDEVRRKEKLTPGQLQRLRDTFALHQKAGKLRQKGDFRGALATLKPAVEAWKELLGEDSQRYAIGLNDTAQLLGELGDYAGAEKLLRKAAEIERALVGEQHYEYVGVLNSLAGALREQADYAGAEPLLRQVLAAHKAFYGDHHLNYAASLNNLGMLLRDKGDVTAAEPLLRRALAIRKNKRGEVPLDYAQALNNLALVKLDLGEVDDARRMFENSLTLRQRLQTRRHPSCAVVLENLGHLHYHQLGDYKAARAYFEEALDIIRQARGDKHPRYDACLNLLVLVLDDMGLVEEARERLGALLALRKERVGTKTHLYASGLANLAMLAKHTGEYHRARQLYEEVLKLYDELQGTSHANYVRALQNYGLVLMELGDLTGAVEILRRAEKDARHHLGPRDPEYARILNNLASVLDRRGDHVEARANYERSMAVVKEKLGEAHPDYASVANNLASLLLFQGDDDAAERLLKQAVAINRVKRGDLNLESAASLQNLAGLYRDRGKYDEALDHFEKARQAYERRGLTHHAHYATVLNNLAYVHFQGGKTNAARELVEKVLAIRKDSLGDDHPDYANSLNSLALLQELDGRLDEARKSYDRAKEVLRARGAQRHQDYAALLRNSALLYARTGKAQAARREAGEALDATWEFAARNLPLLPERDQMALLQELQWSLSLVLSLGASDRAQDEAAYGHLLAWQGIVASAARARHAVRGKPEAKSLIERLDDIRYQLNVLYYERNVPAARADEHARRIKKLMDLRDQIERELAAAAGWALKPVSPEEVVAALAEGAALVNCCRYVRHANVINAKEPAEADYHYAAFVVRRGRPVVRVELGAAKPLEEALLAWGKLLHSGRAGVNDAGRKVADLLWQPLAPHLPPPGRGADVPTVLVVSDGDLHFVPWAALPGKEPGSYLIDGYRFGTLVSGRHLLNVARPPAVPNPESLLAVGGVDYRGAAQALLPPELIFPHVAGPAGRPRLGPLDGELTPVSSSLIDAVGELFRRTRAVDPEKITGAAASKRHVRERMRAKRHVVLHTHANFAPPEFKSVLAPAESWQPRAFGGVTPRQVCRYYPGLLSYVCLAGAANPPAAGHGGPIDVGSALMTAEEVAGQDLVGCETVTLVGCLTGRGRVAGGEGVLGLQRAFHVAGVRTVTASLWMVDAEVSEALMKRYYTHLWQDGLPPGEALRQAQLHFRAGRGAGDSDHPYYWAAWVTSGDLGTADGEKAQGRSMNPAPEDTIGKGDDQHRSAWQDSFPALGMIVGLPVGIICVWGLYRLYAQRKRQHPATG